MEIAPPNLADLSPAELDHLAKAHLDGCLGELDGAAADLRRSCSPVRLATKHPVLVATLAAGAGLMLTRMVIGLRRAATAAPGAAPPPSAGRTFTSSLAASLASIAGRHLPDLILTLLARTGTSGERQRN
jgi:hypothetical protein